MREAGMMVFLEDLPDWDGLIEKFRSAGFRVEPLPGEFPEDEFLLVTKYIGEWDDGQSLDDAIKSVVRAHGGNDCWTSEVGDEIENIRDEAAQLKMRKVTMKKFEQLAVEDQCRLLFQMLEILAEYDCSSIEEVARQGNCSLDMIWDEICTGAGLDRCKPWDGFPNRPTHLPKSRRSGRIRTEGLN
jgi:hypothetical protein